MVSGAGSGNLLVHFGKQLRRLRAEAGITQEQLGQRIGYSATLIGMVETGRRVPSYQLASAADRLLHARGVLEGLWLPIHEQCAPDEQFDEFAEQEARATAIDTYEGHVVPGLLQTEEYTRAIVGSTRPRVTSREVEMRVAVRLARQESLARTEPPRVWAILGEAALHQQRGDRAVMRDQMRRLLDVGESHRFTVQVLPFAAADPAWGTSFSLFHFEQDASVVFMDTFPLGIHHSTKADVVARCQAVFDYLREAALSEARSRDVISERIKQLSRCRSLGNDPPRPPGAPRSDRRPLRRAGGHGRASHTTHGKEDL